MKLLFFAFSILSFIPSFAQVAATPAYNKSNYWYYYDVSAENQLRQRNKDKLLQQKTVVTRRRFADDIVQISYDANGRVNRYQTSKREGRFIYNKEGNEQEISLLRKNKL